MYARKTLQDFFCHHFWYFKLKSCKEGPDIIHARGWVFLCFTHSYLVGLNTGRACILNINFKGNVPLAHSTGRMPASMGRLNTSDDLKAPEYVLRRSFCTGFRCFCRTLDLEALYICTPWSIFDCNRAVKRCSFFFSLSLNMKSIVCAL